MSKRGLRVIAAGVAAASAFALMPMAAQAQAIYGPPIEARVSSFQKIDGLFPMYRDPRSGKLYMEISEDKFDREFISFSYSENGVLDAGAFRGAFRQNRVISMRRYYGRIEIVAENTAFYFDEENALSKASDANISEGILTALPIVGTTPGANGAPTRYLIDADQLFLSEALDQIKRLPTRLAPFFEIGELNRAKAKIKEVRGYDENTDVLVDYVYDFPYPVAPTSEAVTDRRSVVITLQHSLIEMPEEGFEPRLDDYRVGYFTERVTDLTSADAAPYRDLAQRWRLEKKDPDAAISDPVEPITWWIENTTPVELRETIADAVLAWNEAFEKAGFSNAMAVDVQPDDADWDAGDINYNVLRWTSSPQPPFGGYGPSFTNPRTGEIIGADIMLEYAFLTNRRLAGEVFVVPTDDAADPANAHCAASTYLQQSLQFGLAALQSVGASEEEKERLVKEGIFYLILHEVGHTLGLNHNMKASTLYDHVDVHDPSITQGAPTASVMDYPAINFAPLGEENGDFTHTRPGPYDLWAIEFGYRPDMSASERAAILARSTEPGHIFGNDADDMRSPGSGIDPRVMINDMSSDPVAYGIDRIKMVKSVLNGLPDRYEGEESWEAMVRAYSYAMGQMGSMAVVMSRQIGGVYVDRTAPDQSEGAPYTPVPVETQKAAMKALSEHVFAADAFELPQDLIVRLQRQRRGYDFFGGTEDPKIHAQAINIQSSVMSHILHPRVLTRMTDSALYGNEYSPAAMLMDLNDAVVGKDLTSESNTFRRNLQVLYTQALTQIADSSDYDPQAQAAAIAALQDIKGRLGIWPDLLMSTEQRAHRTQVERIIDAAL